MKVNSWHDCSNRIYQLYSWRDNQKFVEFPLILFYFFSTLFAAVLHLKICWIVSSIRSVISYWQRLFRPTVSLALGQLNMLNKWQKNSRWWWRCCCCCWKRFPSIWKRIRKKFPVGFVFKSRRSHNAFPALPLFLRIATSASIQSFT